MSAMEFFAFASYVNYKRLKEQREIEKFRLQHRRK